LGFNTLLGGLTDDGNFRLMGYYRTFWSASDCDLSFINKAILRSTAFPCGESASCCLDLDLPILQRFWLLNFKKQFNNSITPINGNTRAK